MLLQKEVRDYAWKHGHYCTGKGVIPLSGELFEETAYCRH
jgi:hypothetical protein